MNTAGTTLRHINAAFVTQVYSGEDRACRCGCRGLYYGPGDTGHARAVSRANRMLREGTAKVDVDGRYVNLSYGNNRAICLYFDKR